MALRSLAALMRHPAPAACRLHVGIVLSAILAQHNRETGHPFSPDDTDLDVSLARAIGNHRGEPTVDEINRVYTAVWNLELREDGQIDGFKVRLQKREISTRQP
jgi:hypothetical protein